MTERFPARTVNVKHVFPDALRRVHAALYMALCVLLWLIPLTALAQGILTPPAQPVAPAQDWQPPDIRALPAEWWLQFEGPSASEVSDRAKQFAQSMEEYSQALSGDDLAAAQYALVSVRNQFKLLGVARQGPTPDKFEPVPSKEAYLLADLQGLQAQARELGQLKVQVGLQIEQSDSQLKLLRDRRDKLVHQYESTDPESPARILSGISRVAAQAEFELAKVQADNLSQRLKGIDQQIQLVNDQQAFAREHLVATDATLPELDKAISQARARVATMSEKVAGLQPQLLEALSAVPVNPALQMLRKQQMTRASAEAELAQLQEAMARYREYWYRFRADELDYDFDIRATSEEARQLTSDALKQADLWASASQSTLIGAVSTDNLTSVKNFELAMAAARETLDFIGQIRATSDDILLMENLLSTELINSKSGLNNAWARLGLVAANGWNHLVKLADVTLFEMGDTPVTLSDIVKMLFILVMAYGISWLIRYLLNRGLSNDKVSRGAAVYTLSRLLHYLIILIGVFAALGSIGIDFTSFALIAGALSVGIGFGLQAIVNNFVSGLILLFEGTLRVGDYIQLDSGLAGVVREINTRATIVTTNDSVDVVVPNSELVTTKMTNWTLRESVGRIRIPFGVAYGSDKDLVKQVALEAAADVEFALSHTPGRTPELRLVNLGDNALEFVLLIWVNRQGVRRPNRVRASFLWSLETRLRAANIEIPFPQRDIHVRSDFRGPTPPLEKEPPSHPK